MSVYLHLMGCKYLDVCQPYFGDGVYRVIGTRSFLTFGIIQSTLKPDTHIQFR